MNETELLEFSVTVGILTRGWLKRELYQFYRELECPVTIDETRRLLRWTLRVQAHVPACVYYDHVEAMRYMLLTSGFSEIC